MSFATNDEIKAAMIAEVKGRSAITSLLASVNEVRETNWQGDQFGYPCVRIRVIENKPFGSCYSECSVGIQVFSEQKSSEECERISGIISRELHDQMFRQGTVTTHLRITNMLPALRADERTWRTEVIFKAIVSGSSS